MEIADGVVVCLVALTEDLVLDQFFPCVAVDGLVKSELDGVDDIAVELLEVKGGQCLAIVANRFLHMVHKVLFCNKAKFLHAAPPALWRFRA